MGCESYDRFVGAHHRKSELVRTHNTSGVLSHGDATRSLKKLMPFTSALESNVVSPETTLRYVLPLAACSGSSTITRTP